MEREGGGMKTEDALAQSTEKRGRVLSKTTTATPDDCENTRIGNLLYRTFLTNASPQLSRVEQKQGPQYLCKIDRKLATAQHIMEICTRAIMLKDMNTNKCMDDQYFLKDKR